MQAHGVKTLGREDQPGQQPSGTGSATPSTPVTTAQPMVAGGTRTESITGIKAAMARQMMASVQNIPHFTYAEEIDMSALVAMRQRLKPLRFLCLHLSTWAFSQNKRLTGSFWQKILNSTKGRLKNYYLTCSQKIKIITLLQELNKNYFEN